MQVTTKQLITVLNSIGAQFLVVDPETHVIIYANDKAITAFSNSMIGTHCHDIYSRDCECDFCPMPKLFANPNSTIEWESYNPVLKRWIKNVSSLIQWPDGRTVHMQQCIDISEIKQLSEDLARQLEQQKLMSEISQSFISNGNLEMLVTAALNKAGNFLAVDRATVATVIDYVSDSFRYSWCADNVSSDPLFDIGLKRQLVKMWESDKTPYISDKVMTGAFAIAMRNAGLLSFLAIPIILNDKLWGVLSFEMWSHECEWTESDIALGQTITSTIGSMMERERIQLALREEEERVKIMMDTAPLSCSMFDKNFAVVTCNDEAVSLFGAKDKDDFIQRYFDFFPPYQQDGQVSYEKAETLFEEAMEAGRLVTEWEFLHSDGISVIPTELTLARINWRGDNYIVAFAHDLRELQAKMAKIEKTQNELRAAKERAEDSAKAKSNFLATMSHEIRTPLNAIIGMTEIAKNSDDMERIQYCLGRLDDASGHLIGVINDILDMSKIDSGRLELVPTDFLLEDMLRRVSNVANFRAEQKSQELTIRIDKNVPTTIVADPQRLAQVLTNLLANAVKFTPEYGKICLSITKTDETETECELLFEVIDNGIGISKAQQGTLFEVFHQADSSISRRFGGTGLGLAISKSIVEGMGGHIGVESDIDQGSRFFVELKVPKNSIKQASFAKDSDLAQELNVGIFNGKRILLAEDVEINQEILKALMEDTGAEITCANDGREAIDIFSKNMQYFDMILMDIHMPEVDGYQATKTIRALNAAKALEIPIIAMTANVFHEDVARCLASGMNDHIGKPINKDEMIVKLKKYL